MRSPGGQVSKRLRSLAAYRQTTARWLTLTRLRTASMAMSVLHERVRSKSLRRLGAEDAASTYRGSLATLNPQAGVASDGTMPVKPVSRELTLGVGRLARGPSSRTPQLALASRRIACQHECGSTADAPGTGPWRARAQRLDDAHQCRRVRVRSDHAPARERDLDPTRGRQRAW